MAQDILDILLQMRNSGEPYAIATVIAAEGSTSAKTGSKMVLNHSGEVVAGWVGGGCAESVTRDEAIQCMGTQTTSIVDIDMTSETLGVGMPCGGSMRIFIEPVWPAPQLWIVGHGRIAECLCQMADLMGFQVIVHDPQVEPSQYPTAHRLITDDPDYQHLLPKQTDYLVIATQHKGDHESLPIALRCAAQYIALIASRKRTRLIVDYLTQQGFTAQELQRLYAPAGLDLGAKTPEEIALSVLSEIVLQRRQGSGQPMRDRLAQDPLSND